MNKPVVEQIYKKFYNVWFLWAVCFVVNSITLLLIIYKIHPGNGTLALHYNILVGVEWYGKGKNLYFLPAIAFGLSLINFYIFRSLERATFFLASLSLFVSLCVQAIFLLA